ncbi:MAG: CBS domain-containing protein [Deltaproteobacteria bacterium]|nr:MAG: CBS domain-containing protein [Deltaproteobacteria bacterium]
MFGRPIKLFNLLGFEVRVDGSWIIIAGLVVWSLASGLFPYFYPHLSHETYWLMGALGAVGLFLSIIFHEFCHSLVARRFAMPIKGITLFIFGGVAEMAEEPPTARAEFYMAVVGPLSSIFLAGVFYLFHLAGKQGGWPMPVIGVTGYLAWINVLLAGFNLVPAFPLDGGRILRSLLWWARNNLRWATRISSQIGATFGFILLILGVLQIFRGNFIGGLWWSLIGMFLRGAAQMSYQQLLMRKTLEGEPVSRFMNPHPVTVAPSLTVTELVEDYIYKYHFKMFPVVEDGRLLGYITTRQVKEVPREEWGRETIGRLAAPCSSENTVTPDTDAIEALARMNQTGSSRLLVVDQGRLVGIVTLKDLLNFISLKIELEE